MNGTKTMPAVRTRLELLVQHPLGLTAIGISVWDNLNQFLEQAANEMKALGIPPREFFA